MKKYCKICNKNKSLSCFNKVGRQRKGYQCYCRLCSRKKGIENYLKNKTRYTEIAKKRDIKLKKFIAKLKNKPCSDCNKKYPPYVMDFDHLNKNNKIASISYLKRHRVAFKRILEEIKKCELVCANCHRIRSYKRQYKLTNYGEKI